MGTYIRIAVIGLGRLGRWHAENLAYKAPNVRLECVVDADRRLAEKTALSLGVNRWTTKSAEVLEDPDIDAVVIATPTPTHAELILCAARNGKHIFVEKPLMNDLDEAREVCIAIQKHQRLCQVGFMRRFDPAYMEAKRRIVAGDIGKPVYFKAISRDPSSPPEEFIRGSGGIFLDMGIHDYDMARYLMGAEVQSVASHGKALIHSFMAKLGDVDQALSYVTFDNGAAGDIEVSRIALYGYDIRTEVIGTEGTLQIGSLKHHDVRILTSQGSTHDIVPHFPVRFRDAYLSEMNHFIDCLREQTKPSVTETDGMAALEIAVAARNSFETMEIKKTN